MYEKSPMKLMIRNATVLLGLWSLGMANASDAHQQPPPKNIAESKTGKGSRKKNDGFRRPDFNTNEEENEYYGPLDRFWRHHSETKTLVLGGIDRYPLIQSCLDASITADEWTDIRKPQDLDRKVGTRFLDDDGEREVHLIEVVNAMSPIHAKAVRVLKDCVREHIPVLYEKRPMYQVYQKSESEPQSVKDEMGGNNPTHLNSVIAIFLPDVVKEQYKTLSFAYHHAGWQAMVVRDELLDRYRAGAHDAAFTPVEQAGMRACEFLEYEGFNNLMEHQDGFATSVVLNVFLSNGNDYEGGAFYMKDKVYGAYRYVRPEQYSALAFLGGTYDHGVDTILGGTREALSTEFWYYPDLPPGVNLCAADFGNIERHVANCNHVQKTFVEGTKKSIMDYSMHCDLEFPSDSVYGICKSHFGDMRNIYENGEGEGATTATGATATGAAATAAGKNDTGAATGSCEEL